MIGSSKVRTTFNELYILPRRIAFLKVSSPHTRPRAVKRTANRRSPSGFQFPWATKAFGQAMLATTVFLAGIGVGHIAAKAQDAFPRQLKAQDYDRSAPDVQEYSSESRAARRSARTTSLADEFGIPEDQMFALINPQRNTPEISRRSSRAAELSKRPIDCPIELVESDPSDLRGWFQVNYGEPCNLVLYCNWIVDPEVDTAEEIRTQELELAPKSEPVTDEDALPRTALAEGFETRTFADDPHLNNYNQIEREVVLAGTRRCRLTRQCNGKSDPLCNMDFLDQKAEQIEIEQLGK